VPMLINNRLSSSITHQQAAEHKEINIQKRYATTCQVVQYNIPITVVFPLHPTAMLVIEKRKLSPDLPTASPGLFGLPRRALDEGPYWNGSATGFRNRNRIPFRPVGASKDRANKTWMRRSDHRTYFPSSLLSLMSATPRHRISPRA